MKRIAAVASGFAVAFAYCRAARFDEERGFPFTAAFEWRQAAELFAPFAPLAARCWHEWERIMGLPRWLAAPFGADNLAPALLVLDRQEVPGDGLGVLADELRAA